MDGKACADGSHHDTRNPKQVHSALMYRTNLPDLLPAHPLAPPFSAYGTHTIVKVRVSRQSKPDYGLGQSRLDSGTHKTVEA